MMDYIHDLTASDALGEESEALVAVTALMEERRRFETWISALEARRSTTPEHVFARVHADYTTRLEGVILQLTTHTDGLRRAMNSLTMRLGGIREERQRTGDERAEAELRAHVGELSPSDWEATAAASDATLAELAQRHSEVEKELQKTLDLLENAQRPATPAASVAVTPSEAEKLPTAAAEAPGHAGTDPMATDVAPSHAAPSAARAPAFRVVHTTPSLGEVPIEQQTDDGRTAPPTAPASAPAAPRNVAPARKSSFDELAFLSSVVDTPSGSIEPAPNDQADEKTRRDAFAHQGSDDKITNLTDSGSSALGSANMDAAVARSPRPDAMVGRDSLVDGAKTLKCSDCGAMNYPTEWYCERCGAELASL
jgi:hypothetical protein